jgi:hypothetical protein
MGKNRKAGNPGLSGRHPRQESLFQPFFSPAAAGRGGLFRIDALKSVSIGYNNAGVALFER